MEVVVKVPGVQVEVKGDKIIISPATAAPSPSYSGMSSLAQQIASVEADSRPFGDH